MEAVGVNPGREWTPLGPTSSALPLRLSPILLENAVSKGINPRLVFVGFSIDVSISSAEEDAVGLCTARAC